MDENPFKHFVSTALVRTMTESLVKWLGTSLRR